LKVTVFGEILAAWCLVLKALVSINEVVYTSVIASTWSWIGDCLRTGKLHTACRCV